MSKCFPCGQYLINIDGSRKLLELFHPKWNLIKGDSKPDVVLHLEEAKSVSSEKADKEWIVTEDKGLTQVVHCLNGKPVFGLRYEGSVKDISVLIKDTLSHHVRIGIQFGIMLGLYRHCVGFHGVTILCGEEIIILSAASGTGKTTLAKLLEKHCDAIVINGDFALLKPTEEGLVFEPTPFCGSSGRALNHRLKVNRVVFLGQAKENVWRELDGREAMMGFMGNAFIPYWNVEMEKTVQDNILKCISKVRLNRFDFAPTQEAAETFFKNIEHETI